MNEMVAKLFAGFVLTVAAFGAGYWRGDVAATNRDAAMALQAERTAAKKLEEVNTNVRAIEKKSAEEISSISTHYEQELRDVSIKQKNIVSGIRSGAVRLSIATSDRAANATCPIATTASERDGEARSRLSDEAAEFLTGLASEADSLANQLSACQAVIVSDRTAINQQQEERE